MFNLFQWDPQVAKTIDHHHHKTHIITYAIAGAAATCPLALVFLFWLKSPGAALFYIAAMLLFFVPLILYHFSRLLEIHKNPTRYRLYDAVMAENHSSFARTVYLVLEIRKPNGTTFLADTAGVFSPGVLDRTYYGNFFRIKLQVLYDEENGTALVLDPNADQKKE